MQVRARNEFEFLGMLGRGSGGRVFWLGRERPTGQLVAIRMSEEEASRPDAQVAVLHDIGEGVPAGERACFVCGSKVGDWRRYCNQCGTDLTGAAGDLAPELLNALLAEASRQNLDILGQMKRADGGAGVFFGRSRDSQEIVALNARPARTESGDRPSYTLERTTFPDAASGSQESNAAAGRELGVDARTPLALVPRVCPTCDRHYSPDVRFCSHDGSALKPLELGPDLVGRIIADRYHIVRKLGQGGMAQVFLAEHVKMGRRCALKILNRQGSESATLANRFTREAANASRINHPNVVTIYDFGETEDHGAYLAMEYVEGETLAATIRRVGQLDAARSCAIGVEIAAGLAAAHRQNVVHRDLKPDNILIGRDEDGREYVKVVDFGIAKALGTSANTLTQTGFVVGTPQYMSPEQLIADSVDARTDIYSLGCVLYEMLTGLPPFGDIEGTSRLTLRLTEPAPDPRTRVPEVPEAVAALVLKALSRHPAQRQQTATELRDDLRRVLPGSELVRAPPFGLPDRSDAARARSDSGEGPQPEDPSAVTRTSSADPAAPDAVHPLERAGGEVGRSHAAAQSMSLITRRHAATAAAAVLLVAAATAMLTLPRPEGPFIPAAADLVISSPTGEPLPPALTLLAGDTLDLNVVLVHDDGSRIPAGAGVEWSTSEPARAALLPGNRVLARMPGTATVTARLDTFSRSIELTIEAPAPPAVVVAEAPSRAQRERSGSIPVPPSQGAAPGRVAVPVEREAAAPLPPGKLQLIVIPFADVYVDGDAPLREVQKHEFTLAPGRHRLRLVNPNSLPVDTTVEIRSGVTLPLQIRMPPRSL